MTTRLPAPCDAMRNFLQSHWKVILAILLAIVLALLTVETKSAPPPLAMRLKAHVDQLAAATPPATLRHIETSMASYGFSVQPHQDSIVRASHGIEASLANLAPGVAPERIFVVGARIHAGGAAGLAAVLELARSLERQPLARGTEIRFVFFSEPANAQASADPGGADSFMAYVGTRASSERVRHALASLRSDPLPAHHGLIAQAHVMGLTLSGHGKRPGHPALVLTDIGLRFPYFRADTPARGYDDCQDYDAMARIVSGLSRTLNALAGVVQA